MKCFRWLILVVMMAFLTACGGGSDGTPTTDTTNQTDTITLEKKADIVAAPAGILLNQNGMYGSIRAIDIDNEAIYISDWGNSVVQKYSFVEDRVVMTIAQRQSYDIWVGQSAFYTTYGFGGPLQKYSKSGEFLESTPPPDFSQGSVFDPYTDTFFGDSDNQEWIAGFSTAYIFMKNLNQKYDQMASYDTVSLHLRTDLGAPVSTINLLPFSNGNNITNVFCRGDKIYLTYSLDGSERLVLLKTINGSYVKLFDKTIPTELATMGGIKINSSGMAAICQQLVVYIDDDSNSGVATELTYNYITGLDIPSSSQGIPSNILYNVSDALDWDETTAYAVVRIASVGAGNTFGTLNTDQTRLVKIDKATGSQTDVTGGLNLANVRYATLAKYNGKLYIAGFNEAYFNGTSWGSLTVFLEVTDPLTGTSNQLPIDFGESQASIADDGVSLIGSSFKISGVVFESSTSAILAVTKFTHNSGAVFAGLYRYDLNSYSLSLLPGSAPESDTYQNYTKKIPIAYDGNEQTIYFALGGELFSYNKNSEVLTGRNIYADAINISNDNLYLIARRAMYTREYSLWSFLLDGSEISDSNAEKTSFLNPIEYDDFIFFNVDSSGSVDLMINKFYEINGYDDTGTAFSYAVSTGVYEYLNYVKSHK